MTHLNEETSKCQRPVSDDKRAFYPWMSTRIVVFTDERISKNNKNAPTHQGRVIPENQITSRVAFPKRNDSRLFHVL